MPISTRKRRGSEKTTLDDLEVRELEFVRNLINDDLWRPSVAAEKAGYSAPCKAAKRLMGYPAVQKALGQEQRRRLERLQLKADEVLHVLATGLFFNPLSLFHVNRKGNWVVKDLETVPDEVGRCVEQVKVHSRDYTDDEGNVHTETTFELKMMAKTKLLELAMKHCGVDGTQKVEHSGSVGVNVGIDGGIAGLLMEVENRRKSQVIDSTVVQRKLEESLNEAT